MSTTSDSVRDTRTKNEDALEKFDTTDMAGGVLPRDLFEEFYQRVQDEANIMDVVRTEDLPRQKMELARIGVGERMRRGSPEGTGDNSDASISTSGVEMDVEKGTLAWDLTREAVDDVTDNVDEIVLDKMARQFAVDTQDLGINGDGSTGPFLDQNEGWLHILDNSGDTNTYDHSDSNSNPQPVDTQMFHEAIQALPNKFKRSDRVDPVFMLNEDQVQQYRFNLTDRSSPIGDAVILGEEDLTPFDYDIIGVAAFPTDSGLFTHPNNLIYGLYDEVEIQVLDDTDKVAENDLFARYFMRVRDDFQVEDENAAVRINNIAAP
jgi:hypothetical protein